MTTCRCLRELTDDPLRSEYPTAHYMAQALTGEFERVKRWHERINPETGGFMSWLDAMRAAAENSPSFDRMYDEAFADEQRRLWLRAL